MSNTDKAKENDSNKTGNFPVSIDSNFKGGTLGEEHVIFCLDGARDLACTRMIWSVCWHESLSK